MLQVFKNTYKDRIVYSASTEEESFQYKLGKNIYKGFIAENSGFFSYKSLCYILPLYPEEIWVCEIPPESSILKYPVFGGKQGKLIGRDSKICSDILILKKEISGNLKEFSKYVTQEDMLYAFIWSAHQGNLEFVKYFLPKVEINDKGWEIFPDYGKTALFEACREGHLEVVKFLLENKANVHLLYTSHLYSNTVLDLLLTEVANLQENKKITNSQLADYEQIIKLLIKAGAVPKEKLQLTGTFSEGFGML